MEKRKSPIKSILLIAIIVIVCILGIAIPIKIMSTLDIAHLSQNIAFIKKQKEINDYINKYFYKDPDSEKLDAGLYKGLLSGLDDPYSDYYTPEEYDDFNINTSGKYAGIGAVLTQDPDTKEVTVSKIYEGSPAQDAGLKANDTIVSADGEKATDYELSTFVQFIRGEEGTSVTIIYERDDKETEIDIKRREVITPSVAYYMLDEDTGYLQISEFQENTEVEFMDAIHALEKEGMQDIVYDLRANPGGLVSSVTDILDDMLPEGITVYLEDKEKNRTDFTSDEENQLKYPCIVLVNKDSASASEIFAGAIRDYEYGTILGTTTTGKGVVQNIFVLSDGSAIKLTIAEYFTPKGENIHGVGIKPDIEYDYEYLGDDNEEYTWEHDNQIQKALELLNNR